MGLKFSKRPKYTHPVDDTVVLEKYPIFKWKPPKPAPREINYTLKIVEISEGETKEAAIMKSAFFEKRGIKTTSFKYPVSARKFEKGKQYAWQVIGITATERYKSEVWKFTFLICDEPNPCPSAGWNIIIGSDNQTLIDVNANGVCDSGDSDFLPDIHAVIVTPIPWGCASTWGFMTNTPCNAKWISTSANGMAPLGVYTFLRCFDIPDSLKVIEACIEVTADDSVGIYLNGNFIGSHPFPPGWSGQSNFVIPPAFFVSGTNTLKFIVRNIRPAYEGLLYCLHIKTQTCICRTTEPEMPPERYLNLPFPCDSFTECCVKLCKGWTTISFPIREWRLPHTTTLEDLIPHAKHHSDVGRIGDIWWWDPIGNIWQNATSWLLNGTNFGGRNWAKGYAVFSNCSTEYCIAGIPVRSWSTTIYRGWNLIGSVLCDTCPCCCGEAPVGIRWEEPCVTIDVPGGLTSVIGPFLMCGPWDFRDPLKDEDNVPIIEPFKGYWICIQEDSAILRMTCDTNCIVPIPRKPCVAEICTCGEWDDVNVTWTGSFPPNWTGPCGSMLAIPWVCTGTPISINSSINCIPNFFSPNYTWTITKISGPSWTGFSLPATFTPGSGGIFEVILNAACCSNTCPPCSLKICLGEVKDCECQCEILKFYVDGMSCDPGGTISVPLNSTKTISTAAFCSSGSITSYNWTITKPDGSTETKTGSSFNYTFTCGISVPCTYTFNLTVTCSDGSSCGALFYVRVGELSIGPYHGETK